MNKKMNANIHMLNTILHKQNTGWWIIDFQEQKLFFSDFIKDFLHMKSDFLSLQAFTAILREDYQQIFLRAFQKKTLLSEFDFPISNGSEYIWLCVKYFGRDQENEHIAFGCAQIAPKMDIHLPEENTPHESQHLLHHLNSISQILLSFINSDSPELTINLILKNVLKLFGAKHAYICEYNREEQTQSCLYEVTVNNAVPRKETFQHAPLDTTNQWHKELFRKQLILISTLDETPDELLNTADFFIDESVNSLIVIPLEINNEIWGYAGMNIPTRAHQWSNEERLWLKSLANILSLFIELHGSRREKIKSTRRLQTLYDHLPLAYVRIKITFDENNIPVDYTLLNSNKVANALFDSSFSDSFSCYKANQTNHMKEDLKAIATALQDSKAEISRYFEEIDKYFHVMLYPIEQDEIICLLSDITEVFKMHDELESREEILRNIYTNLPVGIELYNQNGLLINTNEKNIEMFGFTSQEAVLGLDLFQEPNFAPEYLEQLRSKESVAFRTSYSFDKVKNYYQTSQKGTKELYIKGSPLYNHKGEVISYLLINIDNTEISQAYSQVADFKNSFSLVSKYGKIGFCKIDLLTNEGMGVDQWYYNLGENPKTPLEQIVGIYSKMHPEDRQQSSRKLQQLIDGEITEFTTEYRIRTSNNTWKWTQTNVLLNPANTDPGKIEVLSINYDITQRKEIEKKLVVAKEKAESSDKLKSAFIANMSHEIRTPLNSIVGFSELLIYTEDQNEKDIYISTIQKNNDLLLQLISDILDLSRIEANAMDFLYEELDINKMCQEIIQDYSLKTEKAPISIVYEKGEISSFRMLGDKIRLTQVISNLISNAIKFTQEGSVTLGFIQEQENTIKFYVLDTGCGISSDEQEVIFKRFFKVNNFAQGTGLGLAICTSIVKQMGGEIGVESEVGKGSFFWFTVPFVQKEDSRENKKENGESDSLTNCKDLFLPIAESNAEKSVILVAEDDQSNFLLIKSILKNRYTLLHATNGIEAIDLLNRNKVNLILMDINMPQMDGITATRKIRSTDKSTPIVILTAYAFDGKRRQALSAGCNNYLSKPIKPFDLLRVIDSELTGSEIKN